MEQRSWATRVRQQLAEDLGTYTPSAVAVTGVTPASEPAAATTTATDITPRDRTAAAS